MQSAWLVGTTFGGLAEKSDPPMGARERVAGRPATDAFSLPQDAGVRRRLTGLP